MWPLRDFQFSIDGHNFTVIANDLVPLVPYQTDSIVIGEGQRYDIIVEANAEVLGLLASCRVATSLFNCQKRREYHRNYTI